MLRENHPGGKRFCVINAGDVTIMGHFGEKIQNALEERASEVSWLEHLPPLETQLNRNTRRWFEKRLLRAIPTSILLF